MKTLFLLRHAKSGWDDGIARDFDRPLNGEGRRAARAIGRFMAAEGVAIDHVLASPAVRVAETIAAVEAGGGTALSPRWDKRLYLATADLLIDIVRSLPDPHAGVLLVGHNPGLEDLVLTLVAADDRDAVETGYPTAALAELTWDGGWADLRTRCATLRRFVRPCDLDPASAPHMD